MNHLPNTNVINLTEENFMNHKNDKIHFKIDLYKSKVYIFITKMYKIVKIYNNECIYIVNLYDFCPILASAYVQSSYLKMHNKNKIKILNKRRDFSVLYNSKLMFQSSYYKCKILMNNIKSIYFSHILNLKSIAHINNKKNELKLILDKMKHIEMKKNVDTFISEIIKSKLLENFDIEVNNKLMYNLIIYYYFKK
jgi:hypothetical protein